MWVGVVRKNCVQSVRQLSIRRRKGGKMSLSDWIRNAQLYRYVRLDDLKESMQLLRSYLIGRGGCEDVLKQMSDIFGDRISPTVQEASP